MKSTHRSETGFERSVVKLATMPALPVTIMMNVANPDMVVETWLYLTREQSRSRSNIRHPPDPSTAVVRDEHGPVRHLQ